MENKNRPRSYKCPKKSISLEKMNERCFLKRIFSLLTPVDNKTFEAKNILMMAHKDSGRLSQKAQTYFRAKKPFKKSLDKFLVTSDNHFLIRFLLQRF